MPHHTHEQAKFTSAIKIGSIKPFTNGRTDQMSPRPVEPLENQVKTKTHRRQIRWKPSLTWETATKAQIRRFSQWQKYQSNSGIILLVLAATRFLTFFTAEDSESFSALRFLLEPSPPSPGLIIKIELIIKIKSRASKCKSDYVKLYPGPSC